jgi:hypothetical protein
MIQQRILEWQKLLGKHKMPEKIKLLISRSRVRPPSRSPTISMVYVCCAMPLADFFRLIIWHFELHLLLTVCFCIDQPWDMLLPRRHRFLSVSNDLGCKKVCAAPEVRRVGNLNQAIWGIMMQDVRGC